MINTVKITEQQKGPRVMSNHDFKVKSNGLVC